jgi:hypothetical protein
MIEPIKPVEMTTEQYIRRRQNALNKAVGRVLEVVQNHAWGNVPSPVRWNVKGEHDKYVVTEQPGVDRLSCTCKAGIRNAPCYHVELVELAAGLVRLCD